MAGTASKMPVASECSALGTFPFSRWESGQDEAKRSPNRNTHTHTKQMSEMFFLSVRLSKEAARTMRKCFGSGKLDHQ
jgi:hypothetical protein